MKKLIDNFFKRLWRKDIAEYDHEYAGYGD